jgi:hypothetical protein
MQQQLNFTQIHQLWLLSQQQQYRDKVKTLRKLSHHIYNLFQKKQLSLEDMPRCIRIVNDIKQFTDWSKASSLSSRITKAWMIGMGFSEPRTMASKRGFVDIESGMIAIGDLDSLKEINQNWCKKMKSANFTEQSSIFDQLLINAINNHKGFYFNTGGDGRMACQIRLVDCQHPIVSAKEMRFVTTTNSCCCIKISSDKISITDFHDIENQHGASLKVEPGYYKIITYHFSIPNKVDSYYVILVAIDKPEPNMINSIDTISYGESS